MVQRQRRFFSNRIFNDKQQIRRRMNTGSTNSTVCSMRNQKTNSTDEVKLVALFDVQ